MSNSVAPGGVIAVPVVVLAALITGACGVATAFIARQPSGASEAALTEAERCRVDVQQLREDFRQFRAEDRAWKADAETRQMRFAGPAASRP